MTGKKRIFFYLFIGLAVFIGTKSVFAGPASSHYELQNYGFGAGGIVDASSSGYRMLGIAGEQIGESATLGQYTAQSGLVYTNQANLPDAPSWTNPGSAYNRLKLKINTADNPSDAKFAVAITDDIWTTIKYIQSDYTVGSVLEAEDWLTYEDWGADIGKYISGLASSTTYKVKVKAKTGVLTETGWSQDASESTLAPSLTFGVSANDITFDPLGGNNSWTDSNKSTTLTTSTNAYNGYTVYGHETGPLKNQYNTTINNYASLNSSPSLWAGTGFGYTTSDSNLAGGVADRFTNSGPKYAGFVTSSPGDPVADHTGPIVENPIEEEDFTVTYRVTATENTPAGSYKNTILYVVVPMY